MKRLAAAFLTLALFIGTAMPAFADSSTDMMAMLDSMKQQMSKMQSTIDQQNARIQELESKTVATAPQAAPAQSGDYQTKLSETDWQKGISDNIGTSLPWMKGLKFGGDFRLRYEGFKYYDKNAYDGLASKGLDHDYNRFRIRLRYGFEKDYGDDWKIGFRLASGGGNNGTQDQTSTNQTLGQYWTYKDTIIDRAYAQYTPNSMKDYGMIKGVTVGAGKFENPFLRYSTTLVWDPDVTPEGAYEKVNFQLVSTEDTKVNLYTTLGQTIVNDGQSRDANCNMFGYQGALNVSTYGFNTELPVDITGALSYYDYTNWLQTVNAVGSNGTTLSFLRTNTLLANDFRVLDFYPEAQFYVNRTPVVLWYDLAVNVGNHGTGSGNTDNPLVPVNDLNDQDTGWGLGLKIGKMKKKSDWEAFGSYFSIGANCVPAAFNDSDFGGPGNAGYTNRKGYKFGLGYMLTDSLTLQWTGYVVSPLDVSAGSGLASSLNESVFRSQLDAVYKF